MMFFQSFIAQASGLAGPLLRYVRRRWLRTLIWAAAACLVVFFYGDAVRLGRWEPLAGETRRDLACAAILAGWALYNVVMLVRDRRTNKTMIDALVKDGQPSKDDLSAQEVDKLRTRLQEAMTQLRRMVGGRRGYLYQLPWYIMIGPPGSGKTTALLNSGLKFPLAETLGRDPLQGVGGTRNCDWWFTEEAILLDTAGRYTTQDSDPEVDQKGWTGFLGLLKQYRPLQPINGVIVALSIEDVASANPQERLANAQAIRARLGELTRTFASRFPIYVLLTKADLLAGFVQFFDAYSRGDREQVWGMTFPLDDGKPETQAAASRFDIEFDQLLTRMNAIVLERLQQESDIQRRGLIYGFPIQVATLKEPIHEVLEEIFTVSKFDQRPLLRGVYFASGTQSGVPIDRMMHAMAATFGMDAPRLPVFSGQEKSYFLTKLLNAVVFAEANVVAADPKLRRRMARTRAIAGAVAGVLVVGLLGAWAAAYAKNKILVARANDQIAAYTHGVDGIPTTEVGDTDFPRIVPPLNQLRDGPAELARDSGSAWFHAGLDQTAKLQSQYADVYQRALNELLLPRVLVLLQNRMRNGRDDDDDDKVGALRLYLSLGGAGPVDKPSARAWMASAWAQLYPDPDRAVLRRDLDQHFAALLDNPLQAVALDATLITAVRRQIQKAPLAARAYNVLKASQKAKEAPSWSIEDAAGAGADVAFRRVSPARLADGVPGLYTRKGYFDVFLPGLHDAVAQAGTERWVYGEDGGSQSESAVTAQAVTLYRADFEAKWTELLNDVRVNPMPDIGAAVKVMNVLSGPESVLTKLINGVVATTDLSPPGPDAKDAESERMRTLVSTLVPGAVANRPPFAPLRAATVASNGQSSQLADLMRTVQTVYEQVSASRDTPHTATGGAPNTALLDATTKLGAQVRQMPPPVRNWLDSISPDVISSGSDEDARRIRDAWTGSGQKLCTQATGNRYPFARRASADISVDDFSHLFGSGGAMDSFFQQNLKQYVNTSHHPWTLENNSRAISPDFLVQFEHADTIKQAFFGGSSAQFHYEITPDYLAPVFNQMTLDVGGQTLTYAHGPVRPITMVWPAPGDGGARLDLEPSTAGSSPIEMPGVWGIFRLIDSGSTYNATRDSFTVSIQYGGQKTSFVIKSDSVLNPFTLRDLRLFHCPST